MIEARHGTGDRYRAGCRCDECRAAYSLYNRRRYEAATPATIELHGTRGAYGRGCRCDECRAARAARRHDEYLGLRHPRRRIAPPRFEPPGWHESRLDWLPAGAVAAALDLGRIARTETYRPGRECEVCARPLSRYNPEAVCAVCRRAEADAKYCRRLPIVEHEPTLAPEPTPPPALFEKYGAAAIARFVVEHYPGVAADLIADRWRVSDAVR